MQNMGSIKFFGYYYLIMILSSQLYYQKFIQLSLANNFNVTNGDIFSSIGFNSSDSSIPSDQLPLDEFQPRILTAASSHETSPFPIMDTNEQINQNSNYPPEVTVDHHGYSGLSPQPFVESATTINRLQFGESSPPPTSWTTWTIATDPSMVDIEQISTDNSNIETKKPFDQSVVKILSVNVQCSLNSMRVSLKFNAPFEGVIYSKDHFHLTECHYVPFQSDRTEFQFDITHNQCGARLINDASSNYPMLEETIVVQNEEMIQEMRDSVQRIRCKSPEMTKSIINTALQVDLKDPVDVTYTEDKLNVFMDIKLGRGPHAAPVTGIVKIGTTLTLVITAVAGGDFDIQVKDCLAHSGDLTTNRSNIKNGIKNALDTAIVKMSDENGCILKPKLISLWRKTSEKNERSGFKMMAYSYLQAFKFPDRMDVFLECNIEICKKHCKDNCVDDWALSRVKRSRRAEDDVLKQMRLQRTLKVVSNEDIRSIHNFSEFEIASNHTPRPSTDVCFTILQFIIAIVIIFVVLIVSCMTMAVVALRKNVKGQLATAMLMDRLAFLENVSRRNTIN